jgi:hypothetical protein
MNHCNDEKIYQEEFQHYLEDVAGQSLRQVELKTRLLEAGDNGLHPLVNEFFAAFEEGCSKLKLPIIRKGS